MSATYDLGDSVKLTFLVSIDGTPTNATVAIVVTKPDGATTSPSITPGPTGTYTAVLAPDQAGPWLFRWTATGAATTAEDGQFTVQANLAATLYTTVQEVREHLGDTGATMDGGQLEAKVRAACRAVDRWCGRRFWSSPAASARTYRPDYGDWAWVDDIALAAGVVVKTDGGDGTYATTWAAGDYELGPDPDAAGDGGAHAFWSVAAVGARRFPLGAQRASLQVTARWGWSQVPDEVREAALLKAVALWKRKDAPFGVAGFNAFGPVRITRLDHDVVALLDPYRRVA